MCVWFIEDIVQEEVEETTHPFNQRNQRACMKTTKKYASDPFHNSTIETGDVLINNMQKEMRGYHHNNQHDPQQP